MDGLRWHNMETIVSACISAATALIVCIVQQNRTMSLIEYKIEELSKRMDKHNTIIERTYALEKASALHGYCHDGRYRHHINGI